MGVYAMLPCQSSCPRYCEGCHKTCDSWKQFVRNNQAENEKKKRYLAYHSERCGTVIRQCARLTPSYTYR